MIGTLYNKFMDNCIDKNCSFADGIYNNHFSFSHIISGTIDDTANHRIDNVRAFRDATTDVFIKNYFSDEKIRFLFLDYTFHMINSIINVKINDYLIKNDQFPLMGNEKVEVVFKGGNVMNIFFKKSMDSGIFDAYKNVSLTNVKRAFDRMGFRNVSDKIMDIDSNNETYGDFLNQIKKKFKISDVDYSIYINSSNYARFILIHGGVVNLLADALSEISILFEMIFSNSHIPYNEDYTSKVNNYDKYHEKNTFIKELNKAKAILIDERFESYIEHINEISTKKIKHNDPTSFDILSIHDNSLPIDSFDNIYYKSIITVLGEIDRNIDIIKRVLSAGQHSLFNLITYLQYIQTIRYITNFYAIKKNDQQLVLNEKMIKQLISKYLYRKQSNLLEINFYDVEKHKTFISDLVQELSNLKNIKKYEQYFTGLDTTRYVYELKDIKNENIKISKRYAIILSSNNNPTRQTRLLQTSDKMYHYITFNNIIHIRHKTVTHFDLMRIKFNVVVDDGAMYKNGKPSSVSIPSEFIDVSIPSYDDGGLKNHMQYDSYTINYEYDDPKTGSHCISINAYDPHELFHDIMYVVFKQNYNAPWLATKYEKRIIRTIYLGMTLAYDEYINTNNDSQLNIYLELLKISDEMLMYIESNGSIDYPYKTVAKFISKNYPDKTYIIEEFESINKKLLYVPYEYLLVIDERYRNIEPILQTIILFGYLMFKKSDHKFKILNKFRKDYGFVEYDTSDTIHAKTVESEMYNNMKTFLKIILNYGAPLFYLYKNISAIIKQLRMTGGNNMISNRNVVDYPKCSVQKYTQSKHDYISLLST